MCVGMHLVVKKKKKTLNGQLAYVRSSTSLYTSKIENRMYERISDFVAKRV